MKNIFTFLLVTLITLSLGNLYAQVGIGTNTPDESSVLDINSENKGLLMPRLNSTQRDLIADPAEGLMIYNTTLNDVQINIGGSLVPDWKGTKKESNVLTNFVNEGNSVSSTSTSNLLLPGMSITPPIGDYSVIFNGNQTFSEGAREFSSTNGVVDIDLIYQDLMAIPATDTTHGPIFGNEVLYPGVYDVSAASSIVGILTLDGGTAVNPVFIIRSTGAFSAGANTRVVLTGNAHARNIYWVSEGAMSALPDSVMKGTLVSRAGAMSLGAGASLEGRLLTKTGAINIAARCILNVPSGDTYINLKSLLSFAMFTALGDVGSDASSIVTGDIGTAIGVLTLGGNHFGVEFTAGTTLITKVTANDTMYSIYRNGIEIINSSRTVHTMNPALISLHAIVSIQNLGDIIEIRWKVSEGESTIKNRSLSLIRF
jgi:hypothetical protein